MNDPASDGRPYETRSVRALRGTEARTIAKWERDGWKVVSRDPGALQTTFTLRRPKPKSRSLLYLVGGSVLALVLVTIITVGSINENNAGPAESIAPASASPQTSAASPESTSTPTPSATAAVTEITAANTPDFAALLALTDYCDASVARFADEYQGREVAFDGNIGAIAPHGDTTTRYDILLGAGDFSETSQPGPAFQFRDVNTTSDLNYAGATPDGLKAGQNVRVQAAIDRYEPNSCLVLLTPEETSFR